MAKTEKELKALKDKVESLNEELKELSEEELEQVTGGQFQLMMQKKKDSTVKVYV